ncbi:MAG: CapA family protein [Chloroflexi bacterium]|nr:CapA family protein [Chloroflexota bacterium]
MIHVVGNVAPGRVEFGEPIESLFGMVHREIKKADGALCQLERIFATGGGLQYRDHNTSNSMVDPGNVKSLAAAGFNIASHAGNRCFDWGPKAGRYTMMVKCVAGRNGVRKVSFLPGYTNQRAEPEFLSRNDPRFEEVLRYVEPGCEKLGTTLSMEGEEAIVFNPTGKQEA